DCATCRQRRRRTGADSPLIGSCGRPIVTDAAGQALLADVACGEAEDDGGGVRRVRGKWYVVAAQENHHGVERDAFVAVYKRIVTGQTERVGCRKCSYFLLPVIPLVDRPQNCRLEKAPIPDAFRSTEYRQLLGMHVDD